MQLDDARELGLGIEASADTRWITKTVALFATVVFVISGSQVLPVALGLSPAETSVQNGLVTAFILNVALVLFAWRRSVQLRLSFAERDRARQQAITLAYVDDVTGLYNRRYFNERIARIAAGKQPVVLLLIDLDHFKEINDVHGHDVGDEVLVTVAGRIRGVCPAESFCVRLGGDEFALVLTGDFAHDPKPQELADTLLEQLNRPITLPSARSTLGASIGIAYDEFSADPSQLLRRSDLAMYEAKRLGRNRWAIFDLKMERELSRRNQIESELRAAIVADEFVPYFQPIIDLGTGEVSGFEVLARWEHPQRGLIEPDEFIPFAEQSGLITELSFRVMERALELTASWPAHYSIAVNVSPLQFKDPLLAQRILKVLATAGFAAGRLELEITETSLIGDREMAQRTIESLRNIGISIAIDDFGTGYSSHTQLRTLPYDRIKIDRSFVASLLDDEQCDAIVQSIVTLGKGLNIPITAEGVETEQIRDKLTSLGCVNAQGWLFAKALSGEEALKAVGGDAPKSPARRRRTRGGA